MTSPPMDTLVSVKQLNQSDGGSSLPNPLSLDATQEHSGQEITPEPVNAVGISSVGTTNTNSTATTTLSQQDSTSESLIWSTLFQETSTTRQNTNQPPTGSITTSASTPIFIKTTSLQSSLTTSPDQISTSPVRPTPRTGNITASTPNEVVVSGTKVAVVEIAGAVLTRQLADTASLMTIILFGLIFFLVTVTMFVTHAYESYRKKDYTQVDYLINGMYDSGV